MATTVNETVLVRITHPTNTVVFMLPAFTQPIVDVCQSVQRHLIEYARASETNDTPTSVADFTLWLIRKASETEPLESEYDNG